MVTALVLAAVVTIVTIGATASTNREIPDATTAGAATHDPVGGERGPGNLDDPHRPQQWYLDRIGLTPDQAAPTGAGQVVAVVDSGVDLDHPDLVESLTRRPDGSVLGRDFVDGDDVPEDRFGHGTMVAGIVAATADNGVGTRGVAPGAEVMPLRVLDDQGLGDTADIAAAIDFAVDHGADVVNLSLESATELAVQDVDEVVVAIRRAVAAGVGVVAAAGNQHAQLEDFAPDLDVLVVGATDRDDHRAGFSDGGRTDLLMAPGVEIVSAWCRGHGQLVCDGTVHNQGIGDGTSFAAPQVSGAIALLMEAGLSAGQAAARLVATARDLGDPGPEARTGVGLLDVAAALGRWPDQPVTSGPGPPAVAAPNPAVGARVPADATPGAVAPAAVPTTTRVVQWVVVVVVALPIGLVIRGMLAQPWIRATNPVPDLRDPDSRNPDRRAPDPRAPDASRDGRDR